MDKYEYKVRSEEITKLIEKEKYAEAVKIADTIDWRRVKSVTMLLKIAALYRVSRRNEDSREMLMLAYERYPTNRSVVYSLCELSIELDDVVAAIEYYKRFVKLAPKDNGVYTLRYRILEAQEASLEERIEILEELKKKDYQEEWAYELAYLYHRVGLSTKCVEECDDIILWFGDGAYVMKAMELKAKHVPLTDAQQQSYNIMRGNAGQNYSSGNYDTESYDDSGYDDPNYNDEGYSDQNYGSDYNDENYDGQNYSDENYEGQNYDSTYSAEGYEGQNYYAEGYDDQSYGAEGNIADNYDDQGYGAGNYDDQGYGVDNYDNQGYGADNYDTQGYTAESYNGQGYAEDSFVPENDSDEFYANDYGQADYADNYIPNNYVDDGYGNLSYVDSGYPDNGYTSEFYVEQTYDENGNLINSGIYTDSDYAQDSYAEPQNASSQAELQKEYRNGLHVVENPAPPAANSSDMSQYNTINLQKVVAESMKELFPDDNDDVFAEDREKYNAGEIVRDSAGDTRIFSGANGSVAGAQTTGRVNVAQMVTGVSEAAPEPHTGAIKKVLVPGDDARSIKSDSNMEELRDTTERSVDDEHARMESHNENVYHEKSLMDTEEEEKAAQTPTGPMKLDEVLVEWERMKQDNARKNQEQLKKRVLTQTGKIFTDFDNSIRSGILGELEREEAEAEKKNQTGAARKRKDGFLDADITGDIPAQPAADDDFDVSYRTVHKQPSRGQKTVETEALKNREAGDPAGVSEYTGGAHPESMDAYLKEQFAEDAAPHTEQVFAEDTDLYAESTYMEGSDGYFGKDTSASVEEIPAESVPNPYAEEIPAEDTLNQSAEEPPAEGILNTYVEEMPEESVSDTYAGKIPEKSTADTNTYTEEIPAESVSDTYMEEMPVESVSDTYMEEMPVESVSDVYTEEAFAEGTDVYSEEAPAEDPDGYAGKVYAETTDMYTEKPLAEGAGAYTEEIDVHDADVYGEEAYTEDSGTYTEEIDVEDADTHTGDMDAEDCVEDTDIYAEEYTDNVRKDSGGYTQRIDLEESDAYADDGYATSPGEYTQQLFGEGTDMSYMEDNEYSQEDTGAYADEFYGEDTYDDLEDAYSDTYDDARYTEHRRNDQYNERDLDPEDAESIAEMAKEDALKTQEIKMNTADLSSLSEKIVATTKKEASGAKREEIRDFTPEEQTLFENFAVTKKIKKQIIYALENMTIAAYTGNVIITGDAGLDTMRMAKNLIKEYQASDESFSGKLAKITGEKINQRNIKDIFEKLNNGGIIIEKANGMSEEKLYELAINLNQDTLGIVVIMEDTKKEITKLLEKQAMIVDYFNIRIDLMEMDNNALVAYAKNYALALEYSIDELGTLALYTRIANMQSGNHVVTKDEVRDIIDEAIWKSKKSKIKNFVDVLFARRYDDEDMIVLKERDFM